MQWLLKKIVGTKNERDLRRLRPLAMRIVQIEEQYRALSDDALKAKTAEFRERLRKGETLDDIMCEAFAAVKSACRRLCGTRYQVCGHEVLWEMVPFDVQLVGGIVLHQGKIAEMATGEGKTLVATMPVYLNALTGRGVHVVTVNDYLARRDAQWMGPVYEFLGVTAGCIQNQMGPEERRAEYAKDITYGTNAEFGFDYLRDNGMATRPEEQVQRGHAYAIIDEVDSILIDEARTPLIISGAAPEVSNKYFELRPRVEALVRRQRELCNEYIQQARAALDKHDEEAAARCLYQVKTGMPKHKQLMHMLEEPEVRKLLERFSNQMLTDMNKERAREYREELLFNIDERERDAHLTEKGCEVMDPADPDAYVLPDIMTAMAELDGDASLTEADRIRKRQEIQEQFAEKSEVIHCVDQLIRAYCLYEKDVDYVVQGTQVLIVDEFTGRILPGRRWSDGLHQAVEAKEGVRIEQETQTLATITIQNYFRMYDKLAGMTGTAETEADEFHEIYRLDVTVIPTNRPVRRVDLNDRIFKTQREKYKAIIDEIQECHGHGQPVLVGTISVETSELLSRMLKRVNIPHNVLNAKNHEREADIVARAGQAGAVTIATNMAGRGTDIKLGEGVVHIDKAVIHSRRRLDDRTDGQSTLRQILTERPCGLHVMGSERHEARRIDRQLRGRCARQGDPGSSRFYVSLEDDLMRLFGSDRIANIMVRLGLEEGQVLEHRWLNKSIETAQRRVEQQNFAIRKRTLEYDDVMNKQREVVYRLRGEVVRSADVRPRLYEIFGEALAGKAAEYLEADAEAGAKRFVEWIQTVCPVSLGAAETAELDAAGLGDLALARAKQAYELKVQGEDPQGTVALERYIVLRAIDSRWQDYLRSMDSLREGVGLRAYGQRDPLIEYKREAYGMFENLMREINEDVLAQAFRSSTSLQAFERFILNLPRLLVHDEVSMFGGGAARTESAGGEVDTEAGPVMRSESPVEAAGVTMRRNMPKVGRNDPCPCGSGKKFKKCCGAA